MTISSANLPACLPGETLLNCLTACAPAILALPAPDLLPSIVHISLSPTKFPLCPRQLWMCAGHLAPIGSATNYHPDGFCNLDRSAPASKAKFYWCIPCPARKCTPQPPSQSLIIQTFQLDLPINKTHWRPLVEISNQTILVCVQIPNQGESNLA